MEAPGVFAANVIAANDFLWKENQRLREENQMLRQQLCQRQETSQRVMQLERRCQQFQDHNTRLLKRMADLKQKLAAKPKTSAPPKPAPVPPPPFVKANTPRRRGKSPGRKAGHPPALRPKPPQIDVHQDVPLPIDPQGHLCCPHCQTQMSQVRHHQRLVEELIPARILTTCYHTASGYCPSCRKRIESRAQEQPPAADLPHAQLGLNALATAAVMRLCYRLPLRQIASLFAQVLKLKLSPAAIVKQLRRLAKWLEKQYHRLKLLLRASGVVYADETSWRTNGRNSVLWTLTNDTQTLYHVDKSRGGKVIAKLLGKSFGSEGTSTLVSDFYSVYDQFDCRQQKCLAHLLRELKDTVKTRPELAGHGFFKRCSRLVRDMLKLGQRRGEPRAAAYAHAVELLEKRQAKLARQPWDDEQAQRLAARLGKYQDKLTTFLHQEQVDPTNNAAERALRPPVVMRKITGGSRSVSGAEAWAILASVFRTIQRQGRDLLDTIKTLLKAQWAGNDITLLADLITPAPSNTS